MKRLLFTLLLLAISVLSLNAYTTYANWASSIVTYYINPANTSGLSNTDVINAIQAAANDWNTQGASNIQLVYGGQVTDTTSAVDGRNVLLFQSTPSPYGYLAFTYSQWDSGNHLVDSDTVFYGPSTFYTQDGTCDPTQNNVIYLHDLATHEFGHMLGLNHSTDSNATMFGRYYSCSQTQRTLETDDILGLQSLYGMVNGPIPLPPPIPPPLCTSGTIVVKTMSNGQVTTWEAQMIAQGYTIVSAIKNRGNTTVTMACK